MEYQYHFWNLLIGGSDFSSCKDGLKDVFYFALFGNGIRFDLTHFFWISPWNTAGHGSIFAFLFRDLDADQWYPFAAAAWLWFLEPKLMWKASNLSSTALSRGCHQCLFRAAWGLRFLNKKLCEDVQRIPRRSWLWSSQFSEVKLVAAGSATRWWEGGCCFCLEKIYCDT